MRGHQQPFNLYTIQYVQYGAITRFLVLSSIARGILLMIPTLKTSLKQEALAISLLDIARGVITVRGSMCPQVVMHLVEAVVRSTQGADELGL